MHIKHQGNFITFRVALERPLDMGLMHRQALWRHQFGNMLADDRGCLIMAKGTRVLHVGKHQVTGRVVVADHHRNVVGDHIEQALARTDFFSARFNLQLKTLGQLAQAALAVGQRRFRLFAFRDVEQGKGGALGAAALGGGPLRATDPAYRAIGAHQPVVGVAVGLPRIKRRLTIGQPGGAIVRMHHFAVNRIAIRRLRTEQELTITRPLHVVTRSSPLQRDDACQVLRLDQAVAGTTQGAGRALLLQKGTRHDG